MPIDEIPVAQRAVPDALHTFRAWVEQHQRAVYALARDLTGNHHDAEDLSQDVFIKAYRGMASFRHEAEVHTWLYRITVNTYLNRRRKKALLFWRVLDDGQLAQQSHNSQVPPDRGIEAEHLRGHIEAALACLSPKERSAFVLRHYHDCSVREVAGVLQVAEGTVKSMLYRSVRKLRAALAPYRPDQER